MKYYFLAECTKYITLRSSESNNGKTFASAHLKVRGQATFSSLYIVG